MTTVEEFKANLRGHLLHPGEDGYDEARKIWNGMFDRRPALIARCAGAADVVSAVNFARDNRLQVAVRGGGHSFPGHSVCDRGLVIDLSPMKGVRVGSVARQLGPSRGSSGSNSTADSSVWTGHHGRHCRYWIMDPSVAALAGCQ
jgi:hypothetical protein